ncbi:hypothetical protein M441DRAFT_62278 [Trichoderma asperellum CBS 433.97]|uniref:Exonuclease domain-containing protein n=2 Tax=Trichoderma asperellum TaxID=101201 RepID=A0A2T3YTQ6_TRIA4|nr:hypothetical protein M441DRAFT_62278 [Trichoderma asperellum CBS 433.97]PTB35894.1 hypothetical protein M441DRAFT_62278 [Trichoderma asperellum CBS 433.97]
MHQHAQIASMQHPPVQEPPPMLQHEGNLYTKLESNQQAAVYKALLVQRHSMDVLLRERFPLGHEPLPAHKIRKGLHIEDFVWAPQTHPFSQKRKAVSLHCVRHQPKHCPVELSAFVAVDFFSGEVLINSRVMPNLGWNGSSRSESLHGWREARANLFDFIDQDTVIVGHKAQINLEMLRLLHKQIVDSQILTTSAIYRPSTSRHRYRPSLEKVCAEFVGIKIKQGAPCPLENALAAREIVLHCIRRPKDLHVWAKETRTSYWRGQEEKNFRRLVKRINSVDSSAVHPLTNLTNPVLSRRNKPVLHDNGPVAAYDDDEYLGGYQDAYEAGFASGFKVGYKRRYEQAGFPVDYAEIEEACPAVKRPKTHEPIQGADDNENPSSFNEHLNQNNNTDMSQAARARSLLAHLMKDTKVKEIIQMLNQAQEKTSKNSKVTSCQTGLGHVAGDC